MKTFWARAVAYPPVACRLLARTNGRHPSVLTDEEIAKRGGLDVAVVKAVQWKTSWSGIDIETMRQFLAGCTMDFENSVHMRRTDQYARKRLLQRLTYLKRDKDWFTKWKPMKEKWLESVQSSQSKRTAQQK